LSKALLLSYLSCLAPGAQVTDPRTHGGPIVYVSDGVEKLTGYRKDQMLGRNAKLFQGLTDEPDAAVADIRAAIAGVCAIPSGVQL
jgi:PAS domain-containing protein